MAMMIDNRSPTIFALFSMSMKESKFFNIYKAKFYQDIEYQKSWGNFIFERIIDTNYTYESTSLLKQSQAIDLFSLTFKLTSIELQGKSIVPKYNIEPTKNECYAYAYDLNPVVKFKTSNQHFVLNFQDYIWVYSDFKSAIKIDVTDLDKNNQDWIQIDLPKFTLHILEIKDKDKSVLVSFTLPIYYSFVVEVSYGKWKISNWDTWKITTDSNEEICFDIIDNMNTVIEHKPSEINNSFTVDYSLSSLLKWALLGFIALLFVIILFSIVCYCIKYKWFNLLSKLKELQNVRKPHSEFTNEMSVVGIKIDPDELRRTSIQSNIRLKVDKIKQ